YTTVGCHLTRSKEFETHPNGPEAYLADLDALIAGDKGSGRVVAIGECGLDYDRLHFSPVEIQKKYFRVRPSVRPMTSFTNSNSQMQLALAKKYHLPLFLHSRAAHVDFVQILKEEGFGEEGGTAVGGRGGVVHSYTGTAAEVAELVCTISFKGLGSVCGLKSEENLEGVKAIPIDRLMLETDTPWCSMRPTHASWPHLENMPAKLRSIYLPRPVKPEKYKDGSPVAGRDEPAAIGGVAWVMHSLLGLSFEALTEQAWKNTVDLFGIELEEENSSQETPS
ncbi:Metallo-dependent hydrolase, partial [Coprinellus micaceus]